MAIEEKVAASLSPKQLARFTEFDELVAHAESNKDAPTPVADFHNALARFIKATETDDASKLALADALKDKGALAYALDTIARVSLLGDALAGKAETVDRTRGDLLASALDMMVKGDALEDDAVPVAQDLVTRWQATKPQRASGSGKSPDALGFRVTTTCAKCQWSSWTAQDNLNSARHQAIRHARKVHNVEMGEGTARFTEITKAMASVGLTPTDGTPKGEATEATGADFTVKRAS